MPLRRLGRRDKIAGSFRCEAAMSMVEHFRQFAGYNAWANRRLYEVAAWLPDADYRRDQDAFFRSVHGTLNHLLATDRIWMRRFTGSGDAPDRLDAIVFDAFPALRDARAAEDARIVDWIATPDDAALDGVIHYRRVSTPQPVEQRLAPALAHWFNHQTHHRGQAHALLGGLGVEPPELDLLFYQRSLEA